MAVLMISSDKWLEQKKTTSKSKQPDDIKDFFPPNEKVMQIAQNGNVWNAQDEIRVFGVEKQVWNIQQLKEYCNSFKATDEKVENTFLWIDIERPSKEVMVAIGILFNLHFLSVERWLDEDQREAVIIYPSYYEISIKNVAFVEGTDLLKIKNTRVTIKKKVIITYHQRHDMTMDALVNKASVWNQKNPEIILFEILHHSIMQFAEWVRIVSEDTGIQQNMQLHVLNQEQLGFIARNNVLEKKIDILLSCLSAKKTMLRFLIRSSHRKTFRMIKESFEVMLRDAYYDFGNVYQRLKIVKELNTFCFQIYYARLNVASTRTDRVNSEYMNLINFISLIFYPITLLVTAFGGNDKVPLQFDKDPDADNSIWAFFGITIFCVFTLVVQSIVFKRLKWY